MFYIEKDKNFAIYSSSGKVLAFNSSVLTAKSKKDSQGVLVMKQGKYKVNKVEICELKTMKKYFKENIPSSGLKMQSKGQQLKF